MRYRTIRLVGLTILIIGLIQVFPGLAQYREYYLSGKVVDTQKNPVAGVQIDLRDVDKSRLQHEDR